MRQAVFLLAQIILLSHGALSVVPEHATSISLNQVDSILQSANKQGVAPSLMVEVGNNVLSLKEGLSALQKATAHKTIATGYFNQSKFVSSLHSLKLAADIFESILDSNNLAQAYNRIGVAYNRMGRYNNAIVALTDALEIRQKLGDSLPIASTYNNLGISYAGVNQLDAAIEAFTKSYTIYNALNNREGESFSLNNLGRIHLDNNDYQPALKHFIRSSELKMALNDSVGLANSLQNIAKVYAAQNSLDKAIEYLLDATKIYNKTRHSFGLASAYSFLAEIYLQIGDPRAALDYIQKSQNIASLKESREQALKNLRLLSDYHYQIGSYQKSSDYLLDYIINREEYFNDQVSSQIAEFSVMYQSEQEFQAKKLLEMNLELEKVKVQKSKFIQNSLLLITIFLSGLLVISTLFMRRYKLKNRAFAKVNAELNHINNHLEIIVENRTRDLLEALQQARESDRLKSTFLANMSHEIRTPLNSILGFSKQLLDQSLDPATKGQYIGIINRKGRGLLQIINDIITISLLDTGQVEVRESSFNLNQLLYELHSKFNNDNYIRKKPSLELKLSVSLSDSRSTIVSDPSKIEQIITNLLENSFKFTSVGSINFGYSVENNQTIKFFVKDTGVGISEGKQERIFSQFNKDLDDVSAEMGGTGLGLPICKGLVNLLKGNIWFKSLVGQGTTFYFEIPYQTSTDRTKSYTSISSISATQLNFTNKKILIVEDDLISYQFIEALLQGTNAKLVHAKNGEDAIEICRIIPDFDLVLMDMRLPFIDGYETTSEIKKINPSLKVIAQTANVMSDDKAKCLKFGCDEYIAKPIDPDEFLRVVAHYLKKSHLS